MRRAAQYSSLIICLFVAACSPDTSKETDAGRPVVTATQALINAAAEAAAADTGAAGEGIDNRGSSAEDTKWWHALPRPEWASYTQVKTLNPWFEVYEIRPDIYAIYEPGQFEEVISWLIVGRTQSLLFDTGLGMGNIRGVVKQITQKPLIVLNSHGHYDHIGGNYQFETIIGRNLPYSRKQAQGVPHEAVAEFASGDWIWKQRPPNFIPREYHIKPYEFSNWVDQGQFIDLGGVSLEVFRAPGHAPDGIVLVDHKRRLMFTGDVFYPAPLYAHLEGSNIEEYAETAERLAAMAAAVDYLLPSHNVPLAKSSYLLQLDAAFKAIFAGTARYETNDDGREYPFEGFSILTLDPPVAAADMELL